MAARCVVKIFHSTKAQILFSIRPRAVLLSVGSLAILRRSPWPRTLCSHNNNERGTGEEEKETRRVPEKNTLDGEDKVTKNIPVGLVVTQGPIGWFTKNLNLWLLTRFYDQNFREGEFLRGAKQALCTVSSFVSQRSFSDMGGIVADSVIQIIMEAVQKQDSGPAVEPSDILTAKITKIGLGYIGGTKQIHIDVAFVCSPLNDGISTKQLGNVKIVRIHQPRLLRYTFRKDCSPGDEWIVVDMDF